MNVQLDFLFLECKGNINPHKNVEIIDLNNAKKMD